MRYLLLLAGFLTAAHAQLSTSQKLFDFKLLAAQYDKHYAPYEWKRDVLFFDLLFLDPWLDRIHRSPNDVTFYEICSQYVASLHDAHSSFSIPSTFSASLGFHADIYDGRVIIDNIFRSQLPASRYPFEIGDELVSIDGKPVESIMGDIALHTFDSNPRSLRRRTAQRLTSRSQSVLPRAHEIGESAVVEIRRMDGALEVYAIPWIKNGTPLTSAGLVPSPIVDSKAIAARAAVSAAGAGIVPSYLEPLSDLRNESVEPSDVLNFGSLNTVWNLPQGFQRRAVTNSFFLSGSYQADGYRIGYIRIPNFGPSSAALAVQAFAAEIAWFQTNTDGLVVDVMRNNGGDACYNEQLQRLLIPYRFRGMGREIRATTRWVTSFSNSLELARAQRQEPHVIALLEANLNSILSAFREHRGRSGPLPICNPGLEREPAPGAYTKPLMVLTDEFSTSAADAFPAVLQDARRGPIFGMRTMGAGGTTGSFRAGIYSEFLASHTAAMHHRIAPVITPEFPPSYYVENVGVRPDIPYDYMTIENLLTRGRPFVEAFTAAIVAHIRGQSPPSPAEY